MSRLAFSDRTRATCWHNFNALTIDHYSRPAPFRSPRFTGISRTLTTAVCRHGKCIPVTQSGGARLNYCYRKITARGLPAPVAACMRLHGIRSCMEGARHIA